VEIDAPMAASGPGRECLLYEIPYEMDANRAAS